MRIALRLGVLCTLLLFAAPRVDAQIFKNGRSSSVVNIGGESYYVHTVKKGETLYALARLYDVTERDIITYNPQAVDGLREDQVLKIPQKDEKPLTEKQQARRFETHTVKQGETAYSISRFYGLSVANLIEDNKDLDPTHLSVGQVLNIRKSGVGSQSEEQLKEQWVDYARTLASVTPDAAYHVVQQGETLYGISRQYDIPQHEITDANNLETSSLRAGTMLKIPLKKEEEAPAVVETPAVGSETSTEGTWSDLFGGRRANLDPRPFDGGTVNIAMMLPLQGSGASGRNFLEFYQGGLIALEDLKRQGVSTQLNLFDTERSEAKVGVIVDSHPFSECDLIIGPVYEESLTPVLRFAREKRVAVVSPLAQIEKQESPLLYQLSPDQTTKYDKLRRVISPDKNIVVVSGTAPDVEFEREIAGLLPSGCTRLTYSRGATGLLDNLVRGEREVVFVVTLKDEYTIDDFMARLSSVRNNLSARGHSLAPVTIVGTSRWQRFTIADKNLFFKLNLCFVSTYHADRSNPQVLEFNKRYIAAFGSLPSLYSYRGYDAVKLFGGAMARWRDTSLSFETALNLSSMQLLQMNYHFGQKARGENHVNTEWALVCYKNDYTIEVK